MRRRYYGNEELNKEIAAAAAAEDKKRTSTPIQILRRKEILEDNAMLREGFKNDNQKIACMREEADLEIAAIDRRFDRELKSIQKKIRPGTCGSS